MSQENVEIVRAVFAAWNAGDMSAIRERLDPDVGGKIVRHLTFTEDARALETVGLSPHSRP